MYRYRNRAWRRFQRIKLIQKRSDRHSNTCATKPLVRGKLSKTRGLPPYGVPHCYRSSKNWKLIYLRKNKLARAAKLKMEYPRKPWWLLYDDLFFTED